MAEEGGKTQRLIMALGIASRERAERAGGPTNLLRKVKVKKEWRTLREAWRREFSHEFSTY